MPGISIHVVDVARGVVAEGLVVSVERIGPASRELLCRGRIGSTGCLDALDSVALACVSGVYEVTLRAGAWYRDRGMADADPPFLGDVVYRFGLADAAQHHHLPFKMTPWGLSCFRGGA
jgi:5-hydroxyisourate hydrolase